MEEEIKRIKMGRPIQEVTLKEVKIRLDREEWEYLMSWTPNASKVVRGLIKQVNDKHRKEAKRQQKAEQPQ